MSRGNKYSEIHPKKKVFLSSAFESRSCVQIVLEIYTLGTYSDVMSYAVRKPEIRPVYGRQSKLVSGNRLFCMELK